MQTIDDLKKSLQLELKATTDSNEIDRFAYLLMNCLRGYSFTDFITHRNELLTKAEILFLQQAIVRLQNHEPIQYVTGQTEFMGLLFKTDKRALIPRPETEELIHHIINNFSDQILTILDIGTGTGCIPIALKKRWPNAIVETWDVSEEAISLAKENAELNDVKISFSETDVFSSPSIAGKYDLIVSNPPYVTNSEKRKMENNVLNFEPHLALFVEDETPLLFYNAIANLGTKTLHPGGRIYFEINEAFGLEVCQLLATLNYKKISLFKDLSGKDRFIEAIYPGNC